VRACLRDRGAARGRVRSRVLSARTRSRGCFSSCERLRRPRRGCRRSRAGLRRAVAGSRGRFAEGRPMSKRGKRARCLTGLAVAAALTRTIRARRPPVPRERASRRDRGAARRSRPGPGSARRRGAVVSGRTTTRGAPRAPVSSTCSPPWRDCEGTGPKGHEIGDAHLRRRGAAPSRRTRGLIGLAAAVAPTRANSSQLARRFELFVDGSRGR
jgi:hypothetical protein